MNDLNAAVNNLKKKYREIFLTSVDEIQKRVDELKPEGTGDIFEVYPESSEGYLWQKSALKLLEDEISSDVFKKWTEVLAYRKQFSCVGCGTCCSLACSEFSPEILKEKALNGDNFATQFTSIFVPYNSKEEAEVIYPEYLKLLEDTTDEEVYFYHCPKLNECKRCSDYENRPKICRVFPDNPLSILPVSCGFYEWRQEVEPIALMLHSMVEIIDYYKNKIPNTKD